MATQSTLADDLIELFGESEQRILAAVDTGDLDERDRLLDQFVARLEELGLPNTAAVARQTFATMNHLPS